MIVEESVSPTINTAAEAVNTQMRLYPCLDHIELHEQPPTYSDSESVYTTTTCGAVAGSNSGSGSSLSACKTLEVSPSAPSYNEITLTSCNAYPSSTQSQVDGLKSTGVTQRRVCYNLRR